MDSLSMKKIEAASLAPYLALAGVAALSNIGSGLAVATFGLAVVTLATFGFGAVDALAADLPGIGGITGGGGPFDKIKTKSDSFVTSMIDIAVPICAVAICVACYAMFTGKMPKTFGMCIIAASVLIGSSVSIAQYLIK